MCGTVEPVYLKKSHYVSTEPRWCTLNVWCEPVVKYAIIHIYYIMWHLCITESKWLYAWIILCQYWELVCLDIYTVRPVYSYIRLMMQSKRSQGFLPIANKNIAGFSNKDVPIRGKILLSQGPKPFMPMGFRPSVMRQLGARVLYVSTAIYSFSNLCIARI